MFRLIITTALRDAEEDGKEEIVLFYEENDDYPILKDMASSFTENKVHCKDLKNELGVIAIRVSIDIKHEVGDGWHTILSSLEFV